MLITGDKSYNQDPCDDGCEDPVDLPGPCDLPHWGNPCKNGGKCYETESDAKKYICVCDCPFYGDHCECM